MPFSVLTLFNILVLVLLLKLRQTKAQSSYTQQSPYYGDVGSIYAQTISFNQDCWYPTISYNVEDVDLWEDETETWTLYLNVDNGLHVGSATFNDPVDESTLSCLNSGKCTISNGYIVQNEDITKYLSTNVITTNLYFYVSAITNWQTDDFTGNLTVTCYYDSHSPTQSPTPSPTLLPTGIPTLSPTPPSNQPTSAPTRNPTNTPTSDPTTSPTSAPTPNPTNIPTSTPTISPTRTPTNVPTRTPTNAPSPPSSVPTNTPTSGPTNFPTKLPSIVPTNSPINSPTNTPTNSPTNTPTNIPSLTPTMPTGNPTNTPTNSPTNAPINIPSVAPTIYPTLSTFSPTWVPTLEQISISNPPTITDDDKTDDISSIPTTGNSSDEEITDMIIYILIGIISCVLLFSAIFCWKIKKLKKNKKILSKEINYLNKNASVISNVYNVTSSNTQLTQIGLSNNNIQNKKSNIKLSIVTKSQPGAQQKEENHDQGFTAYQGETIHISKQQPEEEKEEEEEEEEDSDMNDISQLYEKHENDERDEGDQETVTAPADDKNKMRHGINGVIGTANVGELHYGRVESITPTSVNDLDNVDFSDKIEIQNKLVSKIKIQHEIYISESDSVDDAYDDHDIYTQK